MANAVSSLCQDKTGGLCWADDLEKVWGLSGICKGGEASLCSFVNLRVVTALLQGSGAINLFSQLSQQIIWLNPSVLARTEAMRHLISVAEALPWSGFGQLLIGLGCLLGRHKELGFLIKKKNMLDTAYMSLVSSVWCNLRTIGLLFVLIFLLFPFISFSVPSLCILINVDLERLFQLKIVPFLALASKTCHFWRHYWAQWIFILSCYWHTQYGVSKVQTLRFSIFLTTDTLRKLSIALRTFSLMFLC